MTTDYNGKPLEIKNDIKQMAAIHTIIKIVTVEPPKLKKEKSNESLKNKIKKSLD